MNIIDIAYCRFPYILVVHVTLQANEAPVTIANSIVNSPPWLGEEGNESDCSFKSCCTVEEHHKITARHSLGLASLPMESCQLRSLVHIYTAVVDVGMFCWVGRI